MGNDIRVLIIEDNNHVCETIKDCTAGLRCSFIEAEDEEQALESISSKDFDVIFLDLGLAEVDGLEILRKAQQLRSDLAPVIVLTGYLDENHKKKAQELGIFDYLTKDQLSTKVVTIAITLALKSRNKLYGKEN
jgi:two-component system KDP operon response regulator KdpE